MATKIFPSVNDVNGGTAGQGKTLTEANEISMAGVPYFGKNYVSSGMTGSNGGGLNLTVAAGIACIGGYYVQLTASSSVLLTASVTNYVWLQLQLDGSNNVTGAVFVTNTTGTAPAGAPSVLVDCVVTGVSTITTISDTYRGVIAPGKVMSITEYTATVNSGSITTGQVGWAETLTLVGDGTTPMRLERFDPDVSVGTGVGSFSIEIQDTTFSGTVIAQNNLTVDASGGHLPSHAIRNNYTWLGSKVFYTGCYNLGGPTPNQFISNRSAALRGFFKATFDF